MCDNDIHPGLVEDWNVTRRTFMATGAIAAGGVATGAQALTMTAVGEKDVTIATPDGSADAALFYPDGKGSWPAVLVWPDIMGLRPVFREMGRRLAGAGYVVLVVNPFYRSKKGAPIDGAIDFSNPETRKVLMGYRAAITDDGTDKDAVAYLKFLDAQPQTDKRKKAGVQGYCMGGPLSFRTAAAVPARIGAVGSFHGGGLLTDKPNSPHLLIPKTNAAYLVAVAQNDDAKAPAEKDQLKAAFAAAKKTATVDVYPADHGWCVPGSQAYKEPEAEKAWAELMKLYKAKLV